MKNTSIWIDEKGNIAHRYQKLHLFDMDVKDGPSMRESDTVEAGNEIVAPFDTIVGKVGLMICFDVMSLSFRLLGNVLTVLSSGFPNCR